MADLAISEYRAAFRAAFEARKRRGSPWNRDLIALVQWRNQLTDACGEDLVSLILHDFRHYTDSRMTNAQVDALNCFRHMDEAEQEALVRTVLDDPADRLLGKQGDQDE